MADNDDLSNLEHRISDSLADEDGHLEADVDAAAIGSDAAEVEPESTVSAIRLALAVALPTIGAAILVGGIFEGVLARIYAPLAGILGVLLALALRKLRQPVLLYGLIVAGVFGIGILLLAFAGPGNVPNLVPLVREASKAGDVLRPPVALDPGWNPVIGWILGIVGFSAAWLAIVVKKPSVALLVPLPLAALAGVSVPKEQQIASGIAVLVLFAVGLGVLSSAQQQALAEQRFPLSYELLRAAKALPLIAVITAALVLLAQANILFPKPRIDPTQQPQKPKSVPLTEVQDRVLFYVESNISGPWRMASLDVYDGKDWRLPPFADNRLGDVPRSGIVDEELTAGVTARFVVAGLGGAVLPGLPNPVGIVAEGPKLAYDPRNGNIRVASGQIQPGLAYGVSAAGVPQIEALRTANAALPKEIEQFAGAHSTPPPAAAALIGEANAKYSNSWDKFDFLRNWVLDNVTATGLGVPTSIPPERVQDILGGSREANPFEIVAVQALLARYIGVPSRIGYGFDLGDIINERREVRPKNGASFVEVYFPGFKWLPVIGKPKKAKPTVGDQGQQKQDPSIVPSDDISAQLYLPTFTPPKSVWPQQLLRIVLVVVPTLLLLFLLYLLWPGVAKAFRRSRRRSAAAAAGPRSQIAYAYSLWRDVCTDYGYEFPADTPLMFLDRFIDDDEHNEFAWLVTRSLWGDLQGSIDPHVIAVCEELGRSLARRLANAQPATLRVVATLSRLSLRYPYAPQLFEDWRSKKTPEKEAPRDLVSA